MLKVWASTCLDRVRLQEGAQAFREGEMETMEDPMEKMM